jgi:molybdopterin-guanine dinucleotide biosynthesis protein A
MNRPSPVAGVVLAGGRGRRFGGANKALLPFGDTTLVSWCVRRLAVQTGITGINANRDPEALAGLGATLVPDALGGSRGPLDGVLAAMGFAAAHGYTHVVTVPVDTPFFPDDLVRRFLENRTDAPMVVQAQGRIHGALALWPVGLAAALRRFILESGTLKLTAFLEVSQAVSVPFDNAAPHAFLNINTTQDLEAADALLRGQGHRPRSG